MKQINAPKRPWIFNIIIAAIVLLLLNTLIVPYITEQFVKEVDYGTFIDMLEAGEIAEVMLEDTQITFVPKQGGPIRAYKTGIIPDQKLVDRLEAADVKYGREIPTEFSPLLYFILSWILPFVIIITIGNYFAKKIRQ